MDFNIFTNIYTEKELLTYLSIETNISYLKKELIGYNSNFFLNSEEISDDERLQITNLSVESLINCSNNLSIILSDISISSSKQFVILIKRFARL